MFQILRNKFFLSLVLFFSVFGIFTTTVTAEGAAIVYVHQRWTHEDLYMKNNMAGGTYHAYVKIHWNWAHYAGDGGLWSSDAWAKPTEAWVSVNAPGPAELCGAADAYNGMDIWFKFYQTKPAYSGRTPTHRIPCEYDTVTQRWIDFPAAKRMHYTSQPHYGVHGTILLDFGLDDKSDYETGGFYRR